MRLSLLERHPKGSQAFIPLAPGSFIVVVAEAGPGAVPSLQGLRCFLAAPGQGVNYARGTWHHPLIALATGDFLVVDRGGNAGDSNCDEFALDTQDIYIGLTVSAEIAR
jgi:ureidoglycolate lyase